MKIAAVVAEYNPFHNGHAHQIRLLKEDKGFDYVIAVMSPDFVQRGEPALTGLYDRTRCALAGGVDAVFAMPVTLATGSAEYFAQGGVFIADALGADALSFGCETPDLTLLSRLASIFLEEPAPFKETLQRSLSEGNAFPVARARAALAAVPGLRDLFPKVGSTDFSGCHPGDGKVEADPFPVLSFHELLEAPNNILAVEYLKALALLKSRMQPVPILREGAAYHSAQLAQAQDGQSVCPSATALRSRITRILSEARCEQIPVILRGQIPDPSLLLLSEAICAGRCASSANYDLILHYALLRLIHNGSQADRFSGPVSGQAPAPDFGRTASVRTLSEIQDMNTDLAGRIEKTIGRFETAQSFAAILHTKNIAHTRINRAMLHALLEIPASMPEAVRRLAFSQAACYPDPAAEQPEPASIAFPNLYTQLIGFRKESSPLLQVLKKRSRIPVITKPASAADQLSGTALASFEKDMYARQIYSLLCPASANVSGYQQSVIVLNS